MDQFQDYYSVLQVHPDAEQDMIQNAYKRLCKKYHPDVNPAVSAAEKMQQINGAYEALSTEARRRAYHEQWLRRAGQRTGSSSQARVEVRERVVYVNREPPAAPRHGGTEAAYQVLSSYFRHLASRSLKEAFALISDADRRSISLGSFVDWQESVSSRYEIGSFDLKLFKRYDDLKLDPARKYRAEEYAVTVWEKDRTTGQMRQYAMSKYAVQEGLSWKVYLGYRDLAPLTMQFRTGPATQEEVRILGLWEKYRERHDLSTGLPNRREFEEKLGVLAYTYRRYQRNFTVAVLQVSLPGDRPGGDRTAHLLKYAGYILSRGVRCIDAVAWLGDNRFGVLLAETGRREGQLAARRLLQKVRHDVSACFDCRVDIYAGVEAYQGQEAGELLDGCLRVIGAAGGA